MYVYLQSERAGHDGAETNLFTVGYYLPEGRFYSESDHATREDAAARVAYLNGGKAEPPSRRREPIRFSVEYDGRRTAITFDESIFVGNGDEMTIDYRDDGSVDAVWIERAADEKEVRDEPR